MREFVFPDASLTSRAGQFVWLAINIEDEKNAPFLVKFPGEAVPTFAVVDPKDESVALRLVGSMVTTGLWGWFGANTFGLTLLPLLIGIGLLFFDGKSAAGWVLTLCGAVLIFLGILMNLRVYFAPTSLFNTLVMLLLLAGGLGLVARSLRPRA